jgi:uncharacterized protein (DUF885 family)
MSSTPLLIRASALAMVVLSASPALAAPILATLAIPGEPAFVAIAKDILDVRFAIDPSIAANAGLFDDAARVPSFDSARVAALLSRIDRDLAALRTMPWRSWDVDRQIDWRWMYAAAEDARMQLAEERLYLHRACSWLEPLGNTYIALLTYAPERTDVLRQVTRGIPAMVEEMRRVVVSPTARDVTAAAGVATGILTSLDAEPPGTERDAARAALSAYAEELKGMQGLPEFTVIGATRYEEQLRRALVLPWSPRQLLAVAQRELNEVDAAMAELRPRVTPTSPPAPTPEQSALANDLDQKKLLGLYDEIARADRAFLDASDLLTVPAAVGPIYTRPTPEAMIPLGGDGGSMNPPPPFGDSNVGWWNVEHFKSDWTPEQRVQKVVVAQDNQRTGMGTYAVHEGVPGHHLQLSIARLNPNPLRSILQDNGLVEGWAMYAEEIFWRAGGLGDSPDAEYRKLGSWRFRVRRVFYDVNVECGDWTLQDGADFKDEARHGAGGVDDDILRAINWPSQLICYFAGKTQILELRDAYRAKLGPAYTDRKFNDALLAEGSIPVALIRAKLLGEPVPGVEP